MIIAVLVVTINVVTATTEMDFKESISRARLAGPKPDVLSKTLEILTAISVATTEVVYISENENWFITKFFNPSTGKYIFNLVGVENDSKLLIFAFSNDIPELIVWTKCLTGTVRNISTLSVMIDKNEPHTISALNQFIKMKDQLMSEMKTGNEIKMESNCMEWNNEVQFITVSLEGFEEALNKYKGYLKILKFEKED
jgi:hypothetical protein